jgi:hypothetical protein
VRPGPAVHSDLAALIALAGADEQRAAIGVEVGLVERQRLADPQPGTPEHDDNAAQPDAVGTISGSAHHCDDLLHARRIRWIPKSFVARRDTLVEARRGRRRAASPSAIQQRDEFHDVLLWTMVDTAILYGTELTGTGTSGTSPIVRQVVAARHLGG